MTGTFSGACLCVLTLCLSAAPMAAGADSTALQQRVAALQTRAVALRDINDIKRLQRAYGYYSDSGQWDQVAGLFARTATLEIGLDGVYRGQDRIRQYLLAVAGGHQGLLPGQVNQSLQLMPVVNLAPDGLTAKGTWRAVILTGQAGKSAQWGEGPYENEYVKERGVWKIGALHWYQTLMTPYADGGWARNPDVNGGHYAPASLPADAPDRAVQSVAGRACAAFSFQEPAAQSAHRRRAGQRWQCLTGALDRAAVAPAARHAGA